MSDARNARSDAQSKAGDEFYALVLEPSAPAVAVEPFADDPLAVPAATTATVVVPFAQSGPGTITWHELVETRPDLADYARSRWLGPWSRLGRLPDTFAQTRLSLHRVGAYVISPARRQVNTKIGLRFTVGGFGSPYFVDPDDSSVSVQVRVEGTEIVVQRNDVATSAPITTLRAVGAFVGTDPDVEWAAAFDIPEPGDIDADLEVDSAAAAALADWYGFAYSVLEELRADADSVDASNPQLWPEHFDPAIEVGSEKAKHRGSFGFSPGDAEGGNSEPYIYVSAWHPDSLGDDSFWNSTGFRGAVLAYSELVAAPDQRATALNFLRFGRDLLAQA